MIQVVWETAIRHVTQDVGILVTLIVHLVVLGVVTRLALETVLADALEVP